MLFWGFANANVFLGHHATDSLQLSPPIKIHFRRYCLVNSYFFISVPSENKKDVRSIEETLNDIRAKKRQKTMNDDNAPKSSDDAAE